MSRAAMPDLASTSYGLSERCRPPVLTRSSASVDQRQVARAKPSRFSAFGGVARCEQPPQTPVHCWASLCFGLFMFF